jgi:hypothetical protein
LVRDPGQKIRIRAHLTYTGIPVLIFDSLFYCRQYQPEKPRPYGVRIEDWEELQKKWSSVEKKLKELSEK